MDTFTEELVVKQNTQKDIAKLVVYLLGIFTVPAIFILLGVTVNAYFIIVAICAAFFAIYGSYYLVTGLYKEFEYAVTNSNITVDKVIAKRNRKRVISVDIKRFNSLKKFKDSDFAKKDYRKIFKASITPDGDDVYGAEMHLEKFGGECLLLFSPGEKTLDAMKPYLKNTIKAEMFKNSAKKSSSKKSTAELNKKPDVKTADKAENSKAAASQPSEKSEPENNKTENGNNNKSGNAKSGNTSSKKKKSKKK
ncbi:MAG: hypothetical protein II931_06225 [Clostridia bacterium]|nr:hypothetical protein [Clostridia bacterium]